MTEAIATLLAVALTGITIVAYKHPQGYAMLCILLLFLLAVVFFYGISLEHGHLPRGI